MIICGEAMFDRITEIVTDKPNKQLLVWMIENLAALMGPNDSGRSKAKKVISEHAEFISRPSDLDNVKGITKKIKQIIVDNFPWETVEAQGVIKREYRALKIVFQDTIKMIDMPLSKFGKSFGLEQSKEIFPHSLMTKKFVKAGGIATLSQLKNDIGD